jgi:S1-C subfamily serine protease
MTAESVPEGSFVVEELSALSDAAPEPAPKKAGSKASPKPTAAQKRRPKQGIRVPAATVLRLANAGAVPHGKFSKAQGEHPAGLQLAGVSQFGVGLRDGDVLTEVAGQPATSRAVVVSAVLQARAARAPAISAVFWREGQPWQLLVEMPYLRGS